MDQDLEKLKQEIQAKEAAMKGEAEPVSSSSQVTEIQVEKVANAVAAPVQELPTQIFQGEVERPKDSDHVGEVVEQIFTQAVVHTVATDDAVKENLLNTAKQVVTDKAEAIKSKAETESKAAFFDSHKDACSIFGYDEKTTAKSHVKIMKAWAYFLNTLYIFTIGFFIVSPITFICKKLRVIIKQAWLAVVMAIVIYLGIILVPILTAYLRGLGG